MFSYRNTKKWRHNLGSSDIWDDNDSPKLRSLTKWHTEKRRVRRIIKTK